MITQAMEGGYVAARRIGGGGGTALHHRSGLVNKDMSELRAPICMEGWTGDLQ